MTRTADPNAPMKARMDLLAKEKELNRLREEVARERRALPWVKVDKEYRFNGPLGSLTLEQLFAGRKQLIVYHFMLAPEAAEGCRGCSYVADNFAGSVAHLAARDTTLVAVSRAPLAEIETFRRRMGWTFPWVSSGTGTFNYDFHVAYRPEDRNMADAPGVSVFARGEDGAVHHTYSTFARGLDMLLGTYHYLDLTPAGRAEDGLPHPMAWVRHHDKY